MSASVKYVEWRCLHCGNTVSRAEELRKSQQVVFAVKIIKNRIHTKSNGSINR